MQNACQAGDITDHDIYTLHVEEQRHTTCTVRIMYEVGIEATGWGATYESRRTSSHLAYVSPIPQYPRPVLPSGSALHRRDE